LNPAVSELASARLAEADRVRIFSIGSTNVRSFVVFGFACFVGAPGFAEKITSTGFVLNPPVVPFPSWSDWFLPQHLAPPPLVSAQVYPPPAAIAVTPLVRPTTPTGVLLLVVEPFPS